MKRWSNETLATALLVLGMALLLAWLVTRTEWVHTWRALPRSGEAARDNHFAVKQLFTRLGLTVRSPQNLETLPPPGATLVLTSRHWDFLPERRQALRQWVEQQGGHLVLAQFFAVGDDMAWVPLRQARQTPPARAASAPKAGAPGVAPPVGRTVRPWPPDAIGPPFSPPLLCRAYAESWPPGVAAPHEARQFRLCSAEWWQRIETMPGAQPVWWIDGRWLSEPPRPADDRRLWNSFEPNQAAAMGTPPEREGALALRLALGQGRVTALASWGLFDNDDLFRGQHAQAAVAMIDARAGGEVWFVSDERRDSLAAWLWHHAGPALMLAGLALALALWRSVPRFGPWLPLPRSGRRSVAEQIRGTAAFLLRGDGAALLAATRRALHEAAVRRVAGFSSLPAADRGAALARAAAVPEATLKSALNEYQAMPIPAGPALAERLALLETARRQLNRPRRGR